MGPWVWARVSAKTKNLAVYTAGGFKVAHVDSDDVSYERRRDDARLMASAPDLLGALTLVRMSSGWQCLSDASKAVIVAAIAKATGEQT